MGNHTSEVKSVASTVDRISYFRLLRDAAESYSGLHWLLSCLLVLLFVLWPAVVFWNSIALDVPHFVEEWIKLTSGGLVLLFAFEIGKLNAERRNATLRSSQAFAQHYLPHFESMQSAIADLIVHRGNGDIAKMRASADEGLAHLSKLNASIDLASIFNLDPRLITFLYAERNGEAIRRCSAIWQQCKASMNAQDLTLRELEDARSKLSSLLTNLLALAARVA